MESSATVMSNAVPNVAIVLKFGEVDDPPGYPVRVQADPKRIRRSHQRLRRIIDFFGDVPAREG